MEVRYGELEQKEILSMADGSRIGCADHLLVDLEKAQVKALVVCGRLRWFGLLGRQPDLTIPWEDIEIIGEDAILVKTAGLKEKELRPAKNSWLKQIWRE